MVFVLEIRVPMRSSYRRPEGSDLIREMSAGGIWRMDFSAVSRATDPRRRRRTGTTRAEVKSPTRLVPGSFAAAIAEQDDGKLFFHRLIGSTSDNFASMA